MIKDGEKFFCVSKRQPIYVPYSSIKIEQDERGQLRMKAKCNNNECDHNVYKYLPKDSFKSGLKK